VPRGRGTVAAGVGRGARRGNRCRISRAVAAGCPRDARARQDERAADQGTDEEAQGEPPCPLPGTDGPILRRAPDAVKAAGFVGWPIPAVVASPPEQLRRAE